MKIGYLKDETADLPIREFCGLKTKMYNYIYGDTRIILKLR